MKPTFFLVMLLTVFGSSIRAGIASSKLDSLVLEAQGLVHTNPRLLDSVITVIEQNTLVHGDSFYFVVTTSLKGIKASMNNDFGPSLKYFYDVWQFARRENDTATQVMALANMAGVCQMSGRFKDAKGRLLHAIELTLEQEDHLVSARLTMALGIAEVELNQHDSAIANFKSAIRIFDEFQDGQAVLSCMSELGYALETQHKYKEALDIYKRMDVLYKFTDDVTGEIVANQRKGGTLMQLGRMKDATIALEHSLYLADSMDFNSQKDSTLLRLIKAYAALGDINGAEKYSKYLVSFIQEREEKKNQELIAFVEAKYNLDEKARVNESLAAVLKEAREELHQTKLYFRFAIAGIVVLFLTLLVMYRRMITLQKEQL